MAKMYNQITKQAARKVMDKLDRVDHPLALFAKYGSWQTVKYHSDLFQSKLRQRPDYFRGVFDFNTTIDVLEEELYDSGVK